MPASRVETVEAAVGGQVVVPNLGLDPVVLDRVARRLTESTGRKAVSRAVFDFIVDTQLPALVAGLHRLGFTGSRPAVPRRPRRMNKRAWDSLKSAAEETGLSAAELLRACCELASSGER